jgi:hypothetical protein
MGFISELTTGPNLFFGIYTGTYWKGGGGFGRQARTEYHCGTTFPSCCYAATISIPEVTSGNCCEGRAKKIVIMTGAGISVSAGNSTFKNS